MFYSKSEFCIIISLTFKEDNTVFFYDFNLIKEQFVISNLNVLEMCIPECSIKIIIYVRLLTCRTNKTYTNKQKPSIY